MNLRNRLRPIVRDSLAALPTPAAKAPLASYTLGEEELLAAIMQLLSGQLTMSSEVATFEHEFAAYVGTHHAIMVNSGSSANLLSLAALTNPLYKGSKALHGKTEAIVPAVSWSTSVWPLVQHGFTPVFTDIDLDTFMPSAKSIGEALSEKTGVICCVHLLGGGADMKTIGAHAKSVNAVLFEDSCEALGTTIDGEFSGTIGTAGSYSFFFSHHITTGEGGMAVTDDVDLADVMRIMRAHGWARDSRYRERFEAENPKIDPRFLFVTSGFNLRPTEIAAAIGRVQLRRLAQFNDERRQFAGIILDRLRHLDCVHVPRVPDNINHTWYGLPLVLKADYKRSREEVEQKLAARGVETRPIVAGNMAQQPAFRLFPSRSVALPNAELVMSRGIYLGVNPGMGVDVAEYVGDSLKEALS